MIKKIFILPFTAIILLAFVSCQKEVDETPKTQTEITGNWKFIGLEAKTSTALQVTDGSDVLKTITTSEYVSEKNSGIITIDATKLTSKDISYVINSTAKSSIYQNGTLIDTLSFPFQFTNPASSSSANYKKAGNDTLYFESGLLFMGGSVQNTQAGYVKVLLENDKLYLMQAVTQSTTETDQGATTKSVIQGSMKATLQRQ